MLRLLERRARLVEEALADMSERDAAGLAHEQLRAKQRLQSLDLRAQRRRGDIQPRRRPGEMQRFGHGHEASEMSKLHAPIMRLCPVCASRVTICLASAEEP